MGDTGLNCDPWGSQGVVIIKLDPQMERSVAVRSQNEAPLPNIVVVGNVFDVGVRILLNFGNVLKKAAMEGHVEPEAALPIHKGSVM